MTEHTKEATRNRAVLVGLNTPRPPQLAVMVLQCAGVPAVTSIHRSPMRENTFSGRVLGSMF